MILMNHAMMGAAGQVAGGAGGQQFFYDFESDALGAIPSYLTRRWEPSDEEDGVIERSTVSDLSAAFGNQVFRYSAPGNSYQRSVYEFNEAYGTEADKIQALVYKNNSNRSIPLLVLRGSGEGSPTGYLALIRSDTANFAIRKAVAGAETTLATGTMGWGSAPRVVAFSATMAGGHLELEFSQYNPDNLSDSTTITYTDTDPLPVGFVGIGAMEYSTNFYWGHVGIGLNGASAPMEPI